MFESEREKERITEIQEKEQNIEWKKIKRKEEDIPTNIGEKRPRGKK